ncbi:hypothetical protein DICPUDRAFT_158280 [Dictyostelium purpureum]|uniref:Thioesterase domain-containing protein n=1 Tax=Dictyostelium purpureum TaxID=5786 RepID=F1A191_DICPU|nr:uncharacterized protein DICPUDRAFT_158280 [Dictyostelium purpureum]EGC30041.1 hypothetical protein DICPUDRAFT_158280 [Dictyostelium purpureum]|eukprot:XP_003293428.1 hypothetical protein DICPUDRAFT_158280 [Dictyostelium purpureum]
MNNNIDNSSKNNNTLHTIESIKRYLKKNIENKSYGFNIFKNAQMKKFENGYVEVELIIKKEFTNEKQFAHGGFLAFLLDSFASVCYISTLELSNLNFGVTVNMNVSYISTAKINEKITVISTIEKNTNFLVFANSKIIKEDGSLVAMANVIFKVPKSNY